MKHFLLTLALAFTAHASIIEVDFSGVWDSLCLQDNSPTHDCASQAGLISVGDSFSGSYSYDDAGGFYHPLLSAEWSMIPDNAVVYQPTNLYPTQKSQASPNGAAIVAYVPGSVSVSPCSDRSYGGVEYILYLSLTSAMATCKEDSGVYWTMAVARDYYLGIYEQYALTAAPEPRDTFLCIIFIICGAAIFCAIRYGGWGRS